MKAFMDRDFLLESDTARKLYHDFAEDQPILDYHNHLSVKDIAEHRRFHNLQELWLEGDHYKWRAMRACGVSERSITGDASPYEKYLAWAKILPRLIGSPLYHWTHLELQRYFGIYEVLNESTAEGIWEQACGQMEGAGFDTVSLLNKMGVKALCTTDDPADDLTWHQQIAADETIPFRVLPSFRPDKYLLGETGALSANRAALCEKYGAENIAEALLKALDHFIRSGCKVADHGFSVFPYGADTEFSELMCTLGKAYAERGVVMQLHLGAIRNNSPRLFKAIGPDAGGDSVGEMTDPKAISAFLSDLERANGLPKSILYNLNPNDNRMLSTMAGNFAPRVQFGAAWWFNDHIRGMLDQINELMETNALSASVGMLTDSRSFTSFVRHEYYRRILCNRLGELVESGQYPNDPFFLGEMLKGICYGNAEAFIFEA